MRFLLIFILFGGLVNPVFPSSLPVVKTTADKYAKAKQIFDKLVAARGDLSYPTPTFVLSPVPGKGASCKDGVITLDEQAYDVCTALGEDAESALAILIAHEVIHHYEKHEWEGGFVSLVDPKSSADASGVSKKVKEDLFAQRKDEVEADYLGGFLAHLAGYPATNVMPKVLGGIYKAYNLDENLTKYPPLKERQLIATQTHEKLKQLIDVFEMANLMAAIRQHDIAFTYYDYLLKTFQSREVYNNAGVVYARAAIGMFRKETLKFIYPLELDLQSRLGEQSRGVATNKADREVFIRNAIDHFRRAHLLDRGYTRGLLNEACALALLAQSIMEPPVAAVQQPEAKDLLLEAGIRARQVIRLAGKSDDQEAINNARILLGIVAILEGDKATAKNNFDQAGNGQLAKLNKTVLDQGSLPKPQPTSEEGFEVEETIGDKSITDQSAELPEWETDLLISGGRNRMKFKAAHLSGGSSILQHSLGTGRKFVLATTANKGYNGETALGISIGASQDDVIDAYEQPNYYTPVSGGTVMVYENSRLAFLIQEGKVARWYLYLLKR